MNPVESSTIASRLATARARVRDAAQAARRAESDVTLIAVSKTHPLAAVEEALATGQRVFGENRVQEAKAKFAALRPRFPDLSLHLIGPLQTNKAEDAVRLFDVIHTLDRERLAVALAVAMAKTGKRPRLLVEVNIGREPQKAGIMPEDLGSFLESCRKTHGLTIEGLMAIPPQGEPPEPFFRALRDLAAEHNLAGLSMGMSADFEAAIRCGATCVRVGSVLFGARETSLHRT